MKESEIQAYWIGYNEKPRTATAFTNPSDMKAYQKGKEDKDSGIVPDAPESVSWESLDLSSNEKRITRLLASKLKQSKVFK